MFLDYVALFLLLFTGVVTFYGVIAIHDIPYEIAVKRNHPHRDAIHVAGWVSLFTLHVIWPFLWIWATLWREDRGWGLQHLEDEQHPLEKQYAELTARLAAIEQRLDGERSAQPGGGDA